MDGLRTLAGIGERRDQPVLCLVVRRVGYRPAFSDFDRPVEIASRELHVEQIATCFAKEACIPGPSTIDPTFPRL